MCQLLDVMVNSLKPEADLSEELVVLLQKAMLGRLRDKQAPVRCHAVRVLMRLAEPGSVRNPVPRMLTGHIVQPFGLHANPCKPKG